MVRSAVSVPLKRVVGAVNGAAIDSPLTTRPTVLAIIDAATGTALVSCQGSVTKRHSPSAAIAHAGTAPGPSTGSGVAALGSMSHSLSSRLAADTPSTAA